MIDTTKLYSFNGGEPATIPHRIQLSDGTTRTDNTTFTEEQLIDAGFSGPYEKPVYNENTQEILWDEETLSWNVLDKPPSSPFKSDEELRWHIIRSTRDDLLFLSDWTQIPGTDNPLTEDQRLEWAVYRQELRDLPETLPQDNTILDIDLDTIWPTKPLF
jgi:hypothetical protein